MWEKGAAMSANRWVRCACSIRIGSQFCRKIGDKRDYARQRLFREEAIVSRSEGSVLCCQPTATFRPKEVIETKERKSERNRKRQSWGSAREMF
jgi:hypothetical protein